MPFEVKTPPLPESVSDADVLTWHKQPGDAVHRDENLVDIETDKVVLEVPAPQDGVLQAILAPSGTTVSPGQVLARLAEADESEAGSSVTHIPAQPGDAPPLPPMSPAVKRLVAEHQLEPATIAGTGKDGRILKEDVLAHLENPPPATPPPASLEATPTAAPAPAQTPEPDFPTSTGDPQGRPERRVPMSRLRARIAERLVAAQHNAAMLTTFNEVNMQAVMDLRSRYRDAFEKQHGVRLGFMSFFVKAASEALKRFPAVNASIDGDDIVYHGYYDVGVAVSSPRGLVVPVLRDADRRDMADLESAIAGFAGSARDGTLAIEDITGGTFTITNGGVFGSLMSTPILNPPQSAILGMHKIQERPVAEDGQVVIRPMMYLALSYDHRIIDGQDAVRFLVAIKELLEDPARLLLAV